MTTVQIAQLRIDGGTQPREAISDATVAEYREAMAAGAPFPPVDVFFDGAEYWLADGFHRFHAARANSLTELPATVHAGTRRDAVLYSVGVNQAHGLRRTNADKRKAVLTLLNDAEWCRWSDREIARRCGVHHVFVGDVRRSLVTVTSEKSGRTYTTKHGTEAQMHTEQIGKAGRDRTREGVEQRVQQMREMAAQGHSSRQIAAAFNLGEEGLRRRMRAEGIDVPADRAVARTHRHDSARIIDHMVMDAENLTADVGLIDFGDVDLAQVRAWADSLVRSRDKLSAFIRRLIKEGEKHEAA